MCVFGGLECCEKNVLMCKIKNCVPKREHSLPINFYRYSIVHLHAHKQLLRVKSVFSRAPKTTQSARLLLRDQTSLCLRYQQACISFENQMVSHTPLFSVITREECMPILRAFLGKFFSSREIFLDFPPNVVLLFLPSLSD